MDVQLEIIVLGDAIEETRQVSPLGQRPDCFFGLGQKSGCG